MINTIVLYILTLVFIDLDLDSRPWESKNFCINYLTKFSIDIDGIWYTVRLVCVMNLMFILSCPFNIQGRKQHWCDFVEKKMYINIWASFLLNIILFKVE